MRMQLCINMRVQATFELGDDEQAEMLKKFSDYLLTIGDLSIPSLNSEGIIQLDENMV